MLYEPSLHYKYSQLQPVKTARFEAYKLLQVLSSMSSARRRIGQEEEEEDAITNPATPSHRKQPEFETFICISNTGLCGG